MLKTFLRKLEQTTNAQGYDYIELKQLLNAGHFVIRRGAYKCSPPFEELLVIANEFPDISNKVNTDTSLTEIKEIVAYAIDRTQYAISFLEEKGSLNDMLQSMKGESLTEKEEQVDLALLLVEQKFWSLFSARPKKFSADHIETHDRLHNHILIRWSDGIMQIFFSPDSDLPEATKNMISNEIDRVVAAL